MKRTVFEIWTNVYRVFQIGSSLCVLCNYPFPIDKEGHSSSVAAERRNKANGGALPPSPPRLLPSCDFFCFMPIFKEQFNNGRGKTTQKSDGKLLNN